jgi:hypothetical protein
MSEKDHLRQPGPANFKATAQNEFCDLQGKEEVSNHIYKVQKAPQQCIVSDNTP